MLRFALLVTALAAIAGAAMPAGAGAAVANHIVMYSDPGEYIGQGDHRLFHPGNATIDVSGNAEELTIGINRDTADRYFTLEFAAPPGQVLRPGVYDGAQRAVFREPGHPGIDIGGSGRGCNEVDGRFEVKDIAFRADGTVARLWIVYQHHCEGDPPALFGEVRLGAPMDGDSHPAAAIVRWPWELLGETGATVPVTVMASASSDLGAASIAGDHAGDFAVAADGCAGQTLASAGTCSVHVRFNPTAPGTRTAVLRIPHAGGSHEIPLQGFAYGGTTRLMTQSDGEGPGDDPVARGESRSHTTSDSKIHAIRYREAVWFAVDRTSPEWDAFFAPPEGRTLGPGHYPGAERWPFNGSSPGMDVSGYEGCNTLEGEFTVSELTYDLAGRLRTFGASFVQYCDETPAAVRGTVEFRKGDRTPPPPWMPSAAAASGDPGFPGTGSPPPRSPEPVAPGGFAPGDSADQSAATGGPTATRASVCLRGRSGEFLLIRGSSRHNRILGTAAGEIVLAGAGDDVVGARGGGDCVEGAAGRDALRGGAGNDRLYGGRGDDRLDGGSGRDVLNCGAGRDAAIVSAGDRTKSCERILRPRRKR
jgi:hypothetical protein